jgi:hypothetical protein
MTTEPSTEPEANGPSYRIEAPGLTAAMELIGNGGHVHLSNADDPDDRMCSAKVPCDGHDFIYLYGQAST